VATWASTVTPTLWTEEKPLAPAGNQTMIPWLSSSYPSHHTMNHATLAPTDAAFCLFAKNIHNKLLGHNIYRTLCKVYGEEIMCITQVCASSLMSRHKGI
jgi:hypothetical protein